MFGMLLFVSWLIFVNFELLHVPVCVDDLLCFDLVVLIFIFNLPTQIVYVVMSFRIHNHYNSPRDTFLLPFHLFFAFYFISLYFLTIHIPHCRLCYLGEKSNSDRFGSILKLSKRYVSKYDWIGRSEKGVEVK